MARFLLSAGLSWCDGVVFLDTADRKMVLLRGGMVLTIEQCGIPKAKRFAFYDQVHTTGMDIKHVLDAEAVLTLGKDLVFRDYAQGAFRMRGIGHGTCRTAVPAVPAVPAALSAPALWEGPSSLCPSGMRLSLVCVRL